MKKLTALLLCMLLLAGCANPAVPAEPTVPPATETVPVTNPLPTEPPTDPVMLQFSVYRPNENADGYDAIVMSAAAIDAETLLYSLIWAEVLPEGTLINSLSSEGMQLNVDFNDVFLTHMQSMGSTGELLFVGSVVNTFLKAYQAESMMITVNGEIMESGHVIYDFPIEFME